MRTVSFPIIVLLLLSACGSMQETVYVPDDVYDIRERPVLAATAGDEQLADNEAGTDDYYNPDEARTSSVADRDYYDMTYNDPYYYNYGRFGFGAGVDNYGPSYGMGMSYGWPTSFGSMNVEYGYGGGYGYNPYGVNGWMNGYGYNPYGYYGYGNYGPGYGGYGMGYGPYQGPMGGCYSCYEPGYSTVVYSHRPSTTSGSFNTNSPTEVRMKRNPVGLIPVASPSRNSTNRNARPTTAQPDRTTSPNTRSKTTTRETESRPSRIWDSGGSSSPSRSGGSNSGSGGQISSPRPR